MKTNVTTAKPEVPAELSRTELLACPFCGGPAEIKDAHFFGLWHDYDVSCSVCNARLGLSYTNLKTAIARWNHRQAN